MAPHLRDLVHTGAGLALEQKALEGHRETLAASLDALRASIAELDGAPDAADRGLEAVATFAARMDDRLADPALGPAPEPDPPGWAARQLQAHGVTFGLVVDPGEGPPAPPGGARAALQAAALLIAGPHDGVVDVGAGTGLFGLAAGARGCRVLAVEPDAGRVRLLRASAGRNPAPEFHVVQSSADETALEHLLFAFGWDGASVVRLARGWAGPATYEGMRGLLARRDAPAVAVESSPATATRLREFGYATYLVEPRRLSLVGPGEPGFDEAECCLCLQRRAPAFDGWEVTGA